MSEAVSRTEMEAVHDPASRTFFKKWLVCGPFLIDVERGKPQYARNREKTEKQKEAFQHDFLQEQGGEAGIHAFPGLVHHFRDQEIMWNWYESPSRRIDFWEKFGEIEHAVVYLYLEIESMDNRKAMLRVGSDDAMKMWLNGKMIHSYWGGRQLEINEDTVPVELQPGTNRLLVKVLNMTLHWQFACQIVDPEDLPVGYKVQQMFSFSATRRSPEEIRWRIMMLLSFTIPLLAFIMGGIIVWKIKRRQE